MNGQPLFLSCRAWLGLNVGNGRGGLAAIAKEVSCLEGGVSLWSELMRRNTSFNRLRPPPHQMYEKLLSLSRSALLSENKGRYCLFDGVNIDCNYLKY